MPTQGNKAYSFNRRGPTPKTVKGCDLLKPPSHLEDKERVEDSALLVLPVRPPRRGLCKDGHPLLIYGDSLRQDRRDGCVIQAF